MIFAKSQCKKFHKQLGLQVGNQQLLPEIVIRKIKHFCKISNLVAYRKDEAIFPFFSFSGLVSGSLPFWGIPCGYRPCSTAEYQTGYQYRCWDFWYPGYFYGPHRNCWMRHSKCSHEEKSLEKRSYKKVSRAKFGPCFK